MQVNDTVSRVAIKVGFRSAKVAAVFRPNKRLNKRVTYTPGIRMIVCLISVMAPRYSTTGETMLLDPSRGTCRMARVGQ
jgi:hypothetical protein